jgi:hypothetical protein
MDDFMTTFNSRDFIRDNADYPRRLAPWDHSAWELMKVIQSGPGKVHFAVEFIRYDKRTRKSAASRPSTSSR